MFGNSHKDEEGKKEIGQILYYKLTAKMLSSLLQLLYAHLDYRKG